jgi:hypothetical protein
MSRQASEFQYKAMSLMYRGKEIFKPLNTGWIDEHVACVREFVANIFFYRKGSAMFLSVGNAVTFGGLLVALPSEERFEEFRARLAGRS